MIFVRFVKLHLGEYMIYLPPPLFQIFVASFLEHLDGFTLICILEPAFIFPFL